MVEDWRPTVILNGIGKRFGKKSVLRNLDLTISPDEIVGLVGPNGAGKTTLLRIIAGYLLPDEGMLKLQKRGELSSGPLPIVGYLPEKAPLYDAFTVERYLRLIARLKAIPKDSESAEVSGALEAFGLLDSKKNVIGKLSKGYRQRVGLAQAFLGDSDLLVLDEPMSGLDPFQLVDIRDMILEAADERAILFSTHVMQEVEMLCSRSVFLNDSVLLEIDEGDGEFQLIEVVLQTLDIGRIRSLLKSDLVGSLLEEVNVSDTKYKLILKLSSSEKPTISRLLANSCDLLSFKEVNMGLEMRLKEIRHEYISA